MGYEQYGERDHRGFDVGAGMRALRLHTARPYTASGLPAAVHDYRDRATVTGPGKHTHHLLGEALSWQVCYLQEGMMRPG